MDLGLDLVAQLSAHRRADELGHRRRAGRGAADLAVGWIGDDGSRRWWTVRGRIPAEAATQAERPRSSRAGVELQLPSSRHRVADADAELIAVELPPQLPDALEVDGVAAPTSVLVGAYAND